MQQESGHMSRSYWHKVEPFESSFTTIDEFPDRSLKTSTIFTLFTTIDNAVNVQLKTLPQ